MQEEKTNIIVAIVIGSLFVLLFGFITFLVVVNYVRRKRKLLLEKQAREANFQQELLQAQLEMQDHTLNDLSREIHDNVGQKLSLAALYLNISTMQEPKNEMLQNVKEQVLKANAELRELCSVSMGTRVMEEGLLDAIKRLLSQLSKTTEFAITFHSSIDTLEINDSQTIFLFRMIQEVLHNIVKHSGAKSVHISITKNNQVVNIHIEDDGVGFDAAEPGFKKGIGLHSIQQRASMIGATANIQSEKDKGTIVNLLFNENDHDKNCPG